MFSKTHHFIYLHVPKTGGNSIGSALLPFSGDHKRVSAHQDGMERFELGGDVTPHKHALLADYAKKVDVGNYYVFISVRHPFTRALSYYFSPHRRARQKNDGMWHIAAPLWNEQDFAQCLNELVPMVDFLRVDGKIHKPHDIIRMESIDADFARVATHLKLSIVLEHRNKTAAESVMLYAHLEDAALRKIVEMRFTEDMNYFGY